MLVTQRYRERGRHGHGPMARLRDDAGAVAILVALSVSTFLLGFAALAVDVGQVYTRQGELQSVADAAALAGATELPDIPAARAKAVQTLCSPANKLVGWPDDACTDDGSLPGWVTDNDAANGQILFYGEPDNLGEFTTPLTDDDEDAVGIHVKLPPSTVTFGLARAFGADQISVSKAATARVGTPIGTGVLPFAVTPEDLTDPTREHEFCVLDPTVEGEPPPGSYPGATGAVPLRITLTPFRMDQPTSGQQLTVRPHLGRFTPLPTTSPMWVVIDGRRILSTDHTAERAIVTVDVNLAAGRHDVWIEAGNPLSFVSDVSRLTVVGDLAGDDVAESCIRPDARGVLEIGRRSESADATAVLSDNIKSGIDPTPHRFNEYPDPLLLGLGDVLGLQCRGPLSGLLGALLNVLISLLGFGNFQEDINCVQTRNEDFSDGLTQGLLDTDATTPGRLLRRCEGGETATTRNVTIDGTDLQDVADEGVIGGQSINAIVESGEVVRAAITADAFACPRLGLVPVINPGPVLLHLDGEYPIVDFVYVWIKDDATGLVYENGGNRLRAVEFYVIDPGYFADTVSGSPKIGPYLGPEFPREVLLVKNPGEP